MHARNPTVCSSTASLCNSVEKLVCNQKQHRDLRHRSTSGIRTAVPMYLLSKTLIVYIGTLLVYHS
ncbi:hypothetical protein, partial [Anaplasma phagocytophilum]|uniref:hypothetical protein n=1 Tax=Anaplasma phagocytophilum TaxID=948 RepID=UPI001A9CB287